VSTTIGEVNINLRMSLAQFKKDTQDGTNAARTATKDMADGIKDNTDEAKASLALLGEEFGVNVPRHIRSFITELPGVGTALNAAFSSVALIALIGVIVEVIKKIQEFRAAQQEAAEAGDKVRESIVRTNLEGRAALDELQAMFVDMTDGPIAGAQYRLDHIRESLLALHLNDDLKKDFADLEKSLKGNPLFGGSALGLEGLKSFESTLNEVLQTAGRPAAFEAVVTEIQKTTESIKQLQAVADGPFTTAPQIAALQNYLTALQAIQAKVDVSLTTSATDRRNKEQKQLEDRVEAERQASNQIVEARNKEVDQLDALLSSSQGLLNKNLSAQDQEIAKINTAVEKWVAYKVAVEAAHGGISEVANEQIEALRKEVQILTDESNNAINLALQAAHAANKKDVDKLVTTPTPAIYSGTKEAEDLYKLQHDSAAQVAAAQQIYTQTRTTAEQYKNELAKLNIELEQGAIDQDTYNRAVTAAKQKYDDTTKAVGEFGKNIGDTIKQSVLFGRSWSDTLKSVALDLAQLILKLTLFKSLSASAGAGTGGGLGGFFGALFSGLAGASGGAPGRAGGGPVEAGRAYQWQEHGKEYFVPGTDGVVVPSGATKTAGGGARPIHQVININGVTDMDSFKKSQGQLATEMFNAMASAARRNG
jgi:hypothetical protein